MRSSPWRWPWNQALPFAGSSCLFLAAHLVPAALPHLLIICLAFQLWDPPVHLCLPSHSSAVCSESSCSCGYINIFFLLVLVSDCWRHHDFLDPSEWLKCELSTMVIFGRFLWLPSSKLAVYYHLRLWARSCNVVSFEQEHDSSSLMMVEAEVQRWQTPAQVLSFLSETYSRHSKGSVSWHLLGCDCASETSWNLNADTWTLLQGCWIRI